jgi:RNA polymerase sigma-70 factor (ECF subfamily)
MEKPLAANPEPSSKHARIPDANEIARLEAARQGDQIAFSRLIEPYRQELYVHCYRILGSLYEAEDQVQETMLRAWRRLDTYEGRASFRAWLYKIATNACLDALDRQRVRRSLPLKLTPASDPQAAVAPPLREPVWLEPFPDDWLVETAAGPEARYLSGESVSLAFLAALQVLPPRQRAVLILSDVLDWPAREIADMIGLTVSAVNSALHRARVTLAKQYHGRELESVTRDLGSAKGQPGSRGLTDQRTRLLLERYVQAWESADVAGLVALLKEDAAFSMPPSPSWYQGRTAIAAFVAGTVFAGQGMFSGQAPGRWRLFPTRANAQHAFAIYQRMEGGDYDAFGIHVLSIEGDRLAAVTSFIDPSLLLRFGFPPKIQAEGAR